jgi:serine acetyltransferase
MKGSFHGIVLKANHLETGAGTVVVDDIPDNAAGVPARVVERHGFSRWDIEL